MSKDSSLSTVFTTQQDSQCEVDDVQLIPEATANWLSRLTFHWLTGLLCQGYKQPLQTTDLYRLQDYRSSAHIATLIRTSFEVRQSEASLFNDRLANGEISPGWRCIWWWLIRDVEGERRWRLQSRRRAKLVWAMNDAIKYWFWSSAVLKVLGDTAQLMSSLLVKAIVDFASESYSAHLNNSEIPSIGRGVGLALTLLLLLVISSFANHHYYYRSASTGVLLRGALITYIYDRSLRLTHGARATLSNGRLMNHLSTDISRIDYCSSWYHLWWTGIIQVGICLVLLLVNLGPSALAGFAMFVLIPPVQSMAMSKMTYIRQKSMVWSDKRAKLLREILGGMATIKYFGWEMPFLQRIYQYRRKELNHICSLLLVRSANNGVAMALPIAASVLAFITYSLTGHELEAGQIFASLTLFQLLRLPVMFMPMSFSAISDASNACSRLSEVLEAEILDETFVVDHQCEFGIQVVDAGFSSEGPEIKPDATLTSKHAALFDLRNISLVVPRSKLVVLVGPTGCGKSSFLQGIVGEMKCTQGVVKIGGSVSYSTQIAWIQNTTIRENVLFGRAWDEARYWKAVQDTCLGPDLEALGGDLVEVGEKGVSLSGGQKQRISICRAVYANSDVQIFDDPLSALDAHVGRKVFENVFKASAGSARLLVTHDVNAMQEADYIYFMAEGRISEEGTYDQLSARNGSFSRFIVDISHKRDSKEIVDSLDVASSEVTQADIHRSNQFIQAGIIQAEDRAQGAISWRVYVGYIFAGRGTVVLPFLILTLLLNQGALIMSTYWLVYWEGREWPNLSSGAYMGIYAGLGAAQSLFFFLMASTFAFFTYFASRRLHELTIKRVMYAPMSFFDTTPLGRILNRFSKDIDTIDNALGDALRMFSATFSSIVGAVILISVILPWFLIAAFVISFAYIFGAIFYRASARELKRLDSMLRSSLYAHFSESLSGLVTIRAYGQQERFKNETIKFVDIENRAYWLTVSNQRWLAIRLDFLGSLLTFVAAIVTIASRFKISSSQTGVVLVYVLSIQQAITWAVRQNAEIENNMTSVERVLHYANEVEQEEPSNAKFVEPPKSWPPEGHVEFRDIVLKYRPDLPPVLKGVSMSIEGGERVGVVGRTGAGKTSIIASLLRIVELSGGSILIDGVNISTLRLSDLRNALSIIPQDPVLFSGTVRENLDPFSLYDDVTLWDALKKSHLSSGTAVENVKTASLSQELGLDSYIEEEGFNISVGQRSLISLARALVKNTKILVMDEATASVDYETDRKIQHTISESFSDRTIICIAHRLQTVLSFDKICVMDAGYIAEFDTAENLYHSSDGIFRSMCERSRISLEQIQNSQRGRMCHKTT